MSPTTAQHRPIIPPAVLYPAHVAHLGRAYAAAIEDAGYDALVIDGGAAVPKSRFDDQDWPFRPAPGFAHWLPLAEPDAWLVVESGRRPRLLRRHQSSYWEAPPPSVGEEVWSELDTAAIAGDALARELPQGKRTAYLGEDAARAAAAGIAAEHVNPPALVARLDAIRALKTDYERECILEANRRAVRGHQRVFGAFSIADKSELELHLLYLEVTGQDDQEAPYKGIVALGRHAATLHHVSYDREPSRRAVQSLLVDAGATCRGYASDVTRTAIKGQSGGAASVFADLIVRVETLQQDVIRRIRPGMPYEDLHDQSHVLLAPILRELDMVRASDDELVGHSPVPPARSRPLARHPGARRRLPHRAAAAGEPVPAQHHADHRRTGVHHRAGLLLHPRAPRRAAPRPDRRAGELATGRPARRFRRRADRGRRRRPRAGGAQPHSRGLAGHGELGGEGRGRGPSPPANRRSSVCNPWASI